MKVWVVMSQGGLVRGVFSSEEKAMEAKKLLERPVRKMDGGSVVIQHLIEEHVIDEWVW